MLRNRRVTIGQEVQFLGEKGVVLTLTTAWYGDVAEVTFVGTECKRWIDVGLLD